MALGFGSIALIKSEAVSWANNAATVTFDLPTDGTLFVLGIASQSGGASCVVTSLKHRGVERILGTAGALGNNSFTEGVPFRHLAVVGGSVAAKWPGDWQRLDRIIRTGLARERENPTFPPNKWQREGMTDYDIAVRNVELLAGERQPHVAGFMAAGLTVVMQLADLSGGNDEPGEFTLVGLVLSNHSDAEDVQRADNSPWWFAHGLGDLGTGAQGLKVSSRLNFPTGYLGRNDQGAALFHRQALATIYVDSSGVPATSGLANIVVTNADEAYTPGQFGGSASLASFAGDDGATGDQLDAASVVLGRRVWDKTKLTWAGSSSAQAAASTLYITDYLLGFAA